MLIDINIGDHHDGIVVADRVGFRGVILDEQTVTSPAHRLSSKCMKGMIEI